MVKLLFLLFLPVFFGCGEPDGLVRQKLDLVLEDDLKVMVEEIRQKDASAVLEKPYYRVVQYENFQKSVLFQRKAVVEFYYFRTIQMIQVRKYRYSNLQRQWNRYFKALEYNLS